MSSNYLADHNTVQAKERMSKILQKLKDMVKDTDDLEIKEKVSDFLKNMTDVYTFVVMGEVKAGKSSFINALVGEHICAVSSAPCTRGIHEIRHGADNMEFQISDSYKRQFTSNESLRDIAIVDTPGTNSIMQGDEVLTQKFIPASDLLLIILPAHNPHNDAVWDFVKQAQREWNKRMVFVIQQKDLLDDGDLQQIGASVASYATQLGVTNPLIFSVSAENEIGGDQEHSGYSSLRNYIETSVTGADLMLLKQQSNLQSVQQILSVLEQSFQKRSRQYREDKRIVDEINRALEDFRDSHRDNITELIRGVHSVVDEEIEKYRVEIVRRLEPATIRERFPRQTDFEEWLLNLNENYAKILNNAIDRKSQKAIRSYVADMEDVLNICRKYIQDRPVLLDEEDRLYSSLSKSKQSASKISQITIGDISELNQQLLNASRELFSEIWAARKEYDRQMLERTLKTTKKGVAIGSGLAIAGGLTGAVLATAALPAAFLVGATIGALVGIIATIKMVRHAREMGTAIYSAEMDVKVRESVAKFEADVEQSRLEIRAKLEQEISDLFNNELLFMERSFLEFRLSTYVDDEKLPALEALLFEIKQDAEGFFAEIEALKLNAHNEGQALNFTTLHQEREPLLI